MLGEGSPIYGRVRLWGSVAFMVASTLVGQAVTTYGNHVILWALAGTAAFTAVAAMLQPSMPAAAKPESTNKCVAWPLFAPARRSVRRRGTHAPR